MKALWHLLERSLFVGISYGNLGKEDKHGASWEFFVLKLGSSNFLWEDCSRTFSPFFFGKIFTKDFSLLRKITVQCEYWDLLLRKRLSVNDGLRVRRNNILRNSRKRMKAQEIVIQLNLQRLKTLQSSLASYAFKSLVPSQWRSLFSANSDIVPWAYSEFFPSPMNSKYDGARSGLISI